MVRRTRETQEETRPARRGAPATAPESAENRTSHRTPPQRRGSPATAPESAPVSAVRHPEPLRSSPDELRARLEARRLRAEKREEEAAAHVPKPITEGPVDKIVDVLVNPSASKMLEVTDLDRNQVTLIPTLVVLDNAWEYCQMVATFRQDAVAYQKHYKAERPVASNFIQMFVFTLAQCRRSLGGKTQKALEDLALADLETRGNDEGLGSLDGRGIGD